MLRCEVDACHEPEKDSVSKEPAAVSSVDALVDGISSIDLSNSTPTGDSELDILRGK